MLSLTIKKGEHLWLEHEGQKVMVTYLHKITNGRARMGVGIAGQLTAFAVSRDRPFQVLMGGDLASVEVAKIIPEYVKLRIQAPESISISRATAPENKEQAREAS